MKKLSVLLITMFLASSAFARENLVVSPRDAGQAALGIFAYTETGRDSWPKIYIVIVHDRNRDLPSVYLDFDFIISDVMPPWTSSEYTGIRAENGKVFLKKRGSVFAYLEYGGRSTRAIDDPEMTSNCVIYDPSGLHMLAYCTSTADRKSFQLWNGKHILLASFTKNLTGTDWNLSIEDEGNKGFFKAIALMLAGLHIRPN